MFIVLFMVFNQFKKLKMAPLVLDRTIEITLTRNRDLRDRILYANSLCTIIFIDIPYYSITIANKQLLLLIYLPTPAHFFSVSSHVPNHTSTIGSSWLLTSDNNSCISRCSTSIYYCETTWLRSCIHGWTIMCDIFSMFSILLCADYN
jgi:hypothetical protein